MDRASLLIILCIFFDLTAANKTPDKLNLAVESPMIFPLSYSSLPPRVEDLRRRRLQQSQLPNAHMKLYDDLCANGFEFRIIRYLFVEEDDLQKLTHDVVKSIRFSSALIKV
ncbi:hypothetical protein EUTSA_v10015067mg [Eutrema salsugineum]|uniref:Uncharacterized protein n=1 Tax=Eutrema salsugineum TaxID=72664 RepID=V4LKX3_EUTSA|nr:hypothetical protein EUTSA_v10015067mg [Eutrema salsugineum]